MFYLLIFYIIKIYANIKNEILFSWIDKRLGARITLFLTFNVKNMFVI